MRKVCSGAHRNWELIRQWLSGASPRGLCKEIPRRMAVMQQAQDTSSPSEHRKATGSKGWLRIGSGFCLTKSMSEKQEELSHVVGKTCFFLNRVGEGESTHWYTRANRLQWSTLKSTRASIWLEHLDASTALKLLKSCQFWSTTLEAKHRVGAFYLLPFT